jgi:hypothetical protein
VDDGGAQLRLDIVSDYRKTFFGEAVGPCRVAGDEDRDVVDQGYTGVEGAFRIKSGRFLGTDGEIVEKNLGSGILEYPYNILSGRFRLTGDAKSQFLLIIRKMRCDAVQDASHSDRNVLSGDITMKNRRTIRELKDCLGKVFPDFSLVDVESGNDFDVKRLETSDVPVHEPCRVFLAFLVAIVFNPLDEGGSTVAYPYDRYPYILTHRKSTP